MLKAMSWTESKVPDSSPAPVERPPASNLCPVTIGPVAATGAIVAQGLRRHGEPQVTIAGTQVQVVRDRTDPTRLNLRDRGRGLSPRSLRRHPGDRGGSGAGSGQLQHLRRLLANPVQAEHPRPGLHTILPCPPASSSGVRPCSSVIWSIPPIFPSSSTVSSSGTSSSTTRMPATRLSVVSMATSTNPSVTG